MGRLIKQQSLPFGANSEHLTIQRDYHYDALGQLTHLSGHSLLDTNKKTQQSTRNNQQQNQFTRNHQYQYDALGRLTEHKLTDYQNHTGITEVFAFDPASNRVPVKVTNSMDKALQTDTPKNEHGRPHELIQNGQRIRYTYDSHDRVLYKTIEAINSPDVAPRIALQLQYNANNELEKSLRTKYQNNQVIKTQTEYHYDAFGRRIHKHSETRYLTQSKEQLKQTNKTQHQHMHMLWTGERPLLEYSDSHVYTTIYDQESFEPVTRLVWLRDDIPQPANDEPEVIKDNPHLKNDTRPKSKIEVYHYHNDQLGTPNELTNEQGEVIWLADYEAWGNMAKVIYNEVKINQVQVSQNKLQPIRFQGQHFDDETGLHYNRFRYYDPDMGMFNSRDPIELDGGMNVFAYAPNTTGWVDPLGLDSGINMRNFEGIMGGYTVNDMVPSKVKPLTKNQTVTTDVGLSLKAWLGGGLTFSGGKSYDKNGEVLNCYIVTPCMSAAPGAKAALSLTRTKTNASTNKGISSVSQICGGGSVAAVVGATGGVCQNSDKSISGTGGLLLGGGLDLDVSACQPISYCH